MDLTKYVQSGYGSVFVETNEVKRAVNTIKVSNGLNKIVWNLVQGIVVHPFDDSKNQICNQEEILARASDMKAAIVVLENYDVFLNDVTIVQTFLNKYPMYKSNQVCLVMVGSDRTKIPPLIKELIPVLEFGLPQTEEITKIAENISRISKKGFDEAKNNNTIDEETYNKADFSVNQPVIDACKALTVEEIENVLAYSARVHHRFNIPTILERKRDMLRSTGFMDYIEPEAIENLGGMDIFKQFAINRKEPFDNPQSIRPKVKSILLVGVQGCLAGDTQILIKRGNRKSGRTYSIEEAYYRFNNISRKGIGTGNNQWWDRNIDTYAQCYIGEQFLGWNLIKEIVYSGIKQTFIVTTETGKQIRATKDHEFKLAQWTDWKKDPFDQGFLSIDGGLKVGDKIVCKDDHSIREHLGRSTGRKIIYSIPFHPFANKNLVNGFNYKRLPFARLVVEANMNNLTVEKYIEILRTDANWSSSLKFLLPNIAVHHKDENVSNDILTNLEVMTKKEHDDFHKNKFHSHGIYKTAIAEKIIKIEPGTIEKVYDIKMETPFHNFVANNIVVHNCGKSLAGKILCSIYGWPGIIFDVGAVKGEYVGQTGRNMRLGTKVIDAFGYAIVILDELEKAFEQTEFGGGKQSGGGATADMIGHFLTWSQERTSPAIILATVNKLGALPPEFKRARRWDRIFFVDLPNPIEIKMIIEIKNRQWKANLPMDSEFCMKLYKEGWSGAEIEQLAIDSHYEPIEIAMKQIPILYKHSKSEIDAIRKEGEKYTRANAPYDETNKVTAKAVLKDRKVAFN